MRTGRLAAIGLPLALACLAGQWACSGSTAAPSVIAAAVRAILITPDVFTITSKETKQLTAAVTADAGADKTVIWSSSDTKVATVDQALGLVAGVGAGTARIVATSKATPAVTGTSVVTVTDSIDLTPLFNTFNISATKTTDTGCNFANSFTGQLQASGNKDGSGATFRMIERLTRIYSGTVATSGAYTGTGTGNLDGFIYNGTIAGSISNGGASISGTETLNFTGGCPGKMVMYQFTGSK